MSSEMKYLASGIIAIFALLHLVLISSFGLGVDEAHYGLFALKPDWSYFDHPPVVGWLLALTQFAGPSEIGLRLMPLAFMILNSYLLMAVTLRVYPDSDRYPVMAVLLFQLSIITQLLGWGMVPDVPLMTWGLLMVLVVFRLRESFSLSAFLLFGVLVGLSGLTKYTAITIPVALLIWLVLEKELLNWLKQPGLWLAVIIAGVLITPVLWWNAVNDWVSFAYQFDHGAGGRFRFDMVARMQVAQFAAFAPFVFVLGFWIIGYALKGVFGKDKGSRFSSRERLLLSLAWVNLGLVAWSSGNGEILPHWATIGWMFFTPVIASRAALALSGKRKTAWRILFGLSIFLWVFLYVLLGLKPVNQIKGIETAYQDLLGWEEASQKAVQLTDQHGVKLIWVENWSHASRIAWYSNDYHVQVVDEKPNQFDLWNGEPVATDSAILVTPKKHRPEKAKRIGLEGTGCRWLETMDYQLKGVSVNRFSYYLCQPSASGSPAGH